MDKAIIQSPHAPQAVGPYSLAVQAGNMVFLSGQLGIDPADGNLLDGFDAQTHQVFRNLKAVCQAAGGDLRDIVRLGVFLTDMANFGRFNQIMCEYFGEPYPARAAVQVAGLPKGGLVEAGVRDLAVEQDGPQAEEHAGTAVRAGRSAHPDHQFPHVRVAQRCGHHLAEAEARRPQRVQATLRQPEEPARIGQLDDREAVGGEGIAHLQPEAEGVARLGGQRGVQAHQAGRQGANSSSLWPARSTNCISRTRLTGPGTRITAASGKANCACSKSARKGEHPADTSRRTAWP